MANVPYKWNTEGGLGVIRKLHEQEQEFYTPSHVNLWNILLYKAVHEGKNKNITKNANTFKLKFSISAI